MATPIIIQGGKAFQKPLKSVPMGSAEPPESLVELIVAANFAEATPARLAEARRRGAAGIQVETAFAFCEESGIEANLKFRALFASRNHQWDVFSGPLAFPTGYPFKVLRLDGTASEPGVVADRKRICDLG